MSNADRHDQNEATGTQSKPTAFSEGRAQPTPPKEQQKPEQRKEGQPTEGQQASVAPPAAPSSRAGGRE